MLVLAYVDDIFFNNISQTPKAEQADELRKESRRTAHKSSQRLSTCIYIEDSLESWAGRLNCYDVEFSELAQHMWRYER